MSTLRTCPRCNERTFEKLATHSHCLCCGYSHDLLIFEKQTSDDLPIPPWALEAFYKTQSEKTKSAFNENNLNENPKNKKGSAA